MEWRGSKTQVPLDARKGEEKRPQGGRMHARSPAMCNEEHTRRQGPKDGWNEREDPWQSETVQTHARQRSRHVLAYKRWDGMR
eukprot:scaffold1758_cov333-Pavlova_lutheri.AAC.5